MDQQKNSIGSVVVFAGTLHIERLNHGSGCLSYDVMPLMPMYALYQTCKTCERDNISRPSYCEYFFFYKYIHPILMSQEITFYIFLFSL